MPVDEKDALTAPMLWMNKKLNELYPLNQTKSEKEGLSTSLNGEEIQGPLSEFEFLQNQLMYKNGTLTESYDSIPQFTYVSFTPTSDTFNNVPKTLDQVRNLAEEIFLEKIKECPPLFFKQAAAEAFQAAKAFTEVDNEFLEANKKK